MEDLLVVKRFGNPAYAAFESLGSIRRGKERPLHAAINGENLAVALVIG